MSYASADRAVARALRDALEAAGLDIWLDEDELAGGEAWDAKIRNQIRACTYFMPIISETTQVRREGYFRREWRLAVDRSHDMADDATFLLPVVIDGTSEAGARVPEKFLTVQWLKLPGGQPTPALLALAGRLARGEHVNPRPTQAPFVPPPPPGATRSPIPPPISSTPPIAPAPAPVAAEPKSGHPSLPPFPTRPADRHDRLKYWVEIIIWLCTSAWIVFKWLPKWARYLVILWLVIMAFSHSSKESPKSVHPDKSVPAGETADSDEKPDADSAASLKEAASHLDQLAADPATANLKAGIARAGAEIARAMSKEIAAGASSPAKLGIVPFTGHNDNPGVRKFGKQVMSQVFSQLIIARPGLAQLQTEVHPTMDDATLRALAMGSGEDRLLVAHVEGTDFVVRLLAVATPEEVWTGRYPIQGGDVPGAVAQIIQQVQAAIPPAPPVPPPAKP